MTIILVIAAFASIILIHEFGHFLFSKLLGFKVEEFSVGFGRPLWSKKFGETVYSLRMIPLGGYNKLPDIDAQTDVKLTFSLYWRRFLILAAGGVFNIASAFLAIFFMALMIGVPVRSNVIDRVDPGCIVRIQAGDRITSINGQTATDELIEQWYPSKETVLDFTVERNGEEISFHEDKAAGQPLGITFGTKILPIPPDKSLIAASTATTNIMVSIPQGIIQLAHMSGKEAATSVAGPIGISQVMYQAKDEKGWVGLVTLFAMISINIGMFNLFPIPLLDGGRILVDTIQILTRNALGNSVIKYTNYVGLAMLGTLFLWGAAADCYRIITKYLF